MTKIRTLSILKQDIGLSYDAKRLSLLEVELMSDPSA